MKFFKGVIATLLILCSQSVWAATKADLTITTHNPAGGNLSVANIITYADAKTATTSVDTGKSYSVTFYITTGYKLDSLFVNGVKEKTTTVTSNGNKYNIARLTSDMAIDAYFSLREYKLTAKVNDSNLGAITFSPEPYQYGKNATATIVPAEGYHLSKLLDGTKDVTASVADGKTYEITNITANHTITADFDIDTLNVATEEKTGGKLTLDRTRVTWGDSATVSIATSPGYNFYKLYINNVDVTSKMAAGSKSYKFQVKKDATVRAEFVQINYQINISHSAGGQLTTDRPTVHYNEYAVLVSKPDEGYMLESLIINGNDVTNNVMQEGIYTIIGIRDNQNISATYSPIRYKISQKQSEGGTITIADEEVEFNKSTSAIITAHEGYVTDRIMVNGTDVTKSVKDSTLSLKDIKEDKEISAIFRLLLFKTNVKNNLSSHATLTLSESDHTYLTENTVSYSVEKGYHVDSILINGKDMTDQFTDGKYVIRNVASDIEVAGFFSISEADLRVVTNEGGRLIIGSQVIASNTTDTLKLQCEKEQILSVIPSKGYQLDSIYLGEENITEKISEDNMCTFTVLHDDSLRAFFTLYRYDINVMPTEGGKVNLSDTIGQYGKEITFTVTPDRGYDLSSVTVNGVNVTGKDVDGVYTVKDIRNDQQIIAAFKLHVYTVEIDPAIAHGKVTADRARAEYGSDIMLDITPDPGYLIESLSLNDSVCTIKEDTTNFSFTLRDTTMVKMSFKPIIYHLTTTCSDGGSLSLDTETATYGQQAKLTLTLTKGYHIDSVMVNGLDVKDAMKLTGSYVIENITSDVAIAAYLSSDIHIFEIEENAGGTITLTNGPVPFGKEAILSIVPSTGYKFEGLEVNGKDETSSIVLDPSTNTYKATITSVTDSVKVKGFYTIKSVAIVTSGTNGSLKAPATVNYGDSVCIRLMPDDHYTLDSIFVNGRDMTQWANDTALVIQRVTEALAVNATFALKKFDIVPECTEGGYIDPRESTIIYGNGLDFSVFIREGYQLDSVFIDAEDITSKLTRNPGVKWGDGVAYAMYSIKSITDDTRIRAFFSKVGIDYTISQSEELGSIIMPERVNYGEDVTVTILPNDGYDVANVLVNGKDVTDQLNDGTITIKRVTEAFSIEVTYSEKVFFVTVVPCMGGSIELSETAVLYGWTVTITPIATGDCELDHLYINGIEYIDDLKDGKLEWTMKGDIEVNPIFISPTALDNITADQRDSNIYNLNGQKVQLLQRGQIYVKDGKRIIIK